MDNNNALESYLNDFYNDPNNIEEYKIIFLKNHYYPKINVILNSEFKDFKIGVKKNRKFILWFINNNEPNSEVIYDIKNEEFFIKNIEANKIEKIDYNNYNNNIKKNTNNETCFKRCILC